jgi:CAAX prenyl protease-like protein
MADPMKSKPWLPYVAPFGLYMLFLQLQGSFPQALAWIYPVKTVAVAATLWYFRKSYDELLSPLWCSGASAKRRGSPAEGGSALHRSAATPALAFAVGLVAIVIWIAFDPFYPHLGELMRIKSRVFDPTALAPATRWTFITFRIVGAVGVVPVMEELFWRAFAIRWIDNEDFKRVPVGVFSWKAFAVTVLLFGAEHDQWIAGLVCGALYNWLLYRTRSVWSCVVAHAVSNAALAAWVLARGDWKFW